MERLIEIQERTEQPAIVIRTRAAVQDLPSVIGDAFAEIMAYLSEEGIAAAGAPFAAYYNTDMQNLDIALGVAVPRPVDGKGRMASGTVPGGNWLTTLHIGPYSDLKPVYDALQKAIQERQLEPSGVAYEFYLDPPDTPSDRMRTEVAFPLK